MNTYRICVVCSGNICRSPIAEVVLRAKLEDAGLGDRVVVDSAGTGGWHEGDGADPRALTALTEHGYDGSDHVAREFDPSWFAERDLVLAADRGHLRALRSWAPDPDAATKVSMLTTFSPGGDPDRPLDVADPYTGTAGDFDDVLRQIQDASDGIVEHVREQLSTR